MTITLTGRKAQTLQIACKTLLEHPAPTISEVARVIGKIVSSFPGVLYGPLHYRQLEHDKTTALQNNRWNFDKHMSLSPAARVELTWWISHVIDSVNVMTRENPAHILTTDASGEGWGGGSCGALTHRGTVVCKRETAPHKLPKTSSYIFRITSILSGPPRHAYSPNDR